VALRECETFVGFANPARAPVARPYKQTGERPRPPRRGRRRLTTYGAFIVHPPVLVGLAFAVHPARVPAELKFLAVLAAGPSPARSV
jgi:hypothetical protein